MSRNGKVIVALSGGVDSSVAACLLKEQGYECVGVYLKIGMHAAAPGTAGRPARRVKHDAGDAEATARRLGIPFQALNLTSDFERIIDDFANEYARGRTPNPCVVCNIDIKFGKLLRYADAVDAEFVATGHHARVMRDGEAVRLARSLNRDKDQSYVLFGLRRADLPRCLFPLGEIASKSEVRRLAAELGLRVHDKPESQEICFVPDNDYKRLVRERRPETFRPGEVRDSAGNVLGTHEGVASYTIGQRRGLGIAAGKPIYVTKLDAASNTVTVGPREELLSAGLVADQVNWLSDPPQPVHAGVRAEVQIRYMHTAAPGLIRVLSNGDVEATFGEPQTAVTPGQAAVFYRDDIVLGGGWIREAVQRSE
jgi:tRNA-specific 2-thiouridylase